MAALSIPVRLDADLVAKIDLLAKQQRRSRSQLLRLFIEDAVAAQEAQAPATPAAPVAPGAGVAG